MRAGLKHLLVGVLSFDWFLGQPSVDPLETKRSHSVLSTELLPLVTSPALEHGAELDVFG